MKSKKDNKKDKKNKSTDAFGFGDEEVKDISYFQLFRYASTKEKIMIFIGILGSVVQGATLPLM